MGMLRGAVGGTSRTGIAGSVQAVPRLNNAQDQPSVAAQELWRNTQYPDPLTDTPADLFRNNEIGLWYDASDFSVLFQNAVGSIPVTALGQPVGRILDKSLGALNALGTNVVLNGTFDTSTTGWSTFTNAQGTVTQTINNGVLQVTQQQSQGGSGVYQNITGLTVGKTYRVQATLRTVDNRGRAVSASIRWGNGANNFNSYVLINLNASNNFVTVAGFIEPTLTTITLLLIGGGTGSVNDAYVFEYDDVLVQEVPGNHARQVSDASRPTVQARSNLLVGTTTLATQNVTTLATAHILSFTGTGTVTLSGTSTAGPLIGTGINDRVSLTFTPTAGTLTLTVTGTVTDAQLELGTGVNIYQRVTTATDYEDIGLPRYLQFDGFDDFLVTANTLNMTQTDQVTCCAGLFKQSDAARGIVAEIGSSSFNAWQLNAPDTPPGRYAFASVGSANSTTRAAFDLVSNAPAMNVITGLAHLSQDVVRLRVNNQEQQPDLRDQGPGAYGNLLMYVGRRNGTTLPFGGRLYQFVVRGVLTYNKQLTRLEQYVAAAMGLQP